MLSCVNSFNTVFYTSNSTQNRAVIRSLTSTKQKEGFVIIQYTGIFDNVSIICDNNTFTDVYSSSFVISNLLCDTSYNITVIPYKNNIAGTSKSMTTRTIKLLLNETANSTLFTNFKTLTSTSLSIPNTRYKRYTAGGAGYSLRKINKDYVGNCIKIYRRSDGAYLDVGFKNYVVDISAILLFCGSENGFVQTWYDQINNFHLIQTNTLCYPQIVNNGSMIYLNNFPHIIFSGGYYNLYNDSTYTTFLYNENLYMSNFSNFNMSFIGTNLKVTNNSVSSNTLFYMNPFFNSNYRNNGVYALCRFDQHSVNLLDSETDRNGYNDSYFNNNYNPNVENKTFVLNININQTSSGYSTFSNNNFSNILPIKTNTFFSDTSLNPAPISGTVISRYGLTNYFSDKNKWVVSYDASYNKNIITDMSKAYIWDSSGANQKYILDLSSGPFVVGMTPHPTQFPQSVYKSDFFGGMHELIIGISSNSVTTLFPANQKNYIFDDFYYFA